jgi:hypothetical protein
MDAYMNFLLQNMGGMFYEYLDTSSVASLCGVNKSLCHSINTHMEECSLLGKRAFPRAAYFENTSGAGYITYTRDQTIITSHEGSVWRITASPFDPNSSLLVARMLMSRRNTKDLYRLVTHNASGSSGLGHYMTKHDALAICESFKWWRNRKMVLEKKRADEAAAAEAAAQAAAVEEEKRKKTIFPLRTSAAVTNPWKRV